MSHENSVLERLGQATGNSPGDKQCTAVKGSYTKWAAVEQTPPESNRAHRKTLRQKRLRGEAKKALA